MDFEKYMIAQEGLFSRIRETRANDKKIKEYKDKILDMDPNTVAKQIMKCLTAFSKSSEGMKMNYMFGTDSSSEQAMRTLLYNYQAEPGKIHPTTSTMVKINGVGCVLVTKQDKAKDWVEFAQLAVPVYANGKMTQEIITPTTAAKLFLNNNITL